MAADAAALLYGYILAHDPQGQARAGYAQSDQPDLAGLPVVPEQLSADELRRIAKEAKSLRFPPKERDATLLLATEAAIKSLDLTLPAAAEQLELVTIALTQAYDIAAQHYEQHYKYARIAPNPFDMELVDKLVSRLNRRRRRTRKRSNRRKAPGQDS